MCICTALYTAVFLFLKIHACAVLGVYSWSSSNSSERRSLDPLHQSAAGNVGHEPARFSCSDSQVNKLSVAS